MLNGALHAGGYSQAGAGAVIAAMVAECTLETEDADAEPSYAETKVAGALSQVSSAV